MKVDEAKFKVDFEDLNVAGTTKVRLGCLYCVPFSVLSVGTTTAPAIYAPKAHIFTFE